MFQKWRTYQHIVLWVALTIALSALDWPLGILSPFWQRYSFMTGVVTGLLLLGFGLFAVEAWFKEREVRRWSHVAYIAAKELGFVTDNLLSGMNYLLYGRRHDGDGVLVESHLHERLISCLDRHGISQDGNMSLQDRINILLDDREWLKLAVVLLDILKHQHRRNLATWVPVFLTIDKMTPLIDKSALANEWIFQLQDIFRVVIDPGDARFANEEVQRIADDQQALRSHAIQQWRMTHDGIVNLQQECMRAAQLAQWENPHKGF